MNSKIPVESKHLVIGILAHVDAGKTTLAESILYTQGSIRKLGRVDHKDAHLDTYDLERARGITIFAKQAQLQIEEMVNTPSGTQTEIKNITLLDTPGHVDFSAEMERTLQVLDYAILVISGSDGVQSHVKTLWYLLKKYNTPVIIFVNKMDQEGTNEESIMDDLRKRLDDNCVDFTATKDRDVFWEKLAMCDEHIMNQYLEGHPVREKEIGIGIKKRHIFPCFFGSALKLIGIEKFLEGVKNYTLYNSYPKEFGARVFKISRDIQGNRLTYLKITGGILKVKQVLEQDEKVDQIRIYSGNQYESVESVSAGAICAVTGLSQTFCGQGFGIEVGENTPLLAPVLTYRIRLPEGSDVYKMLGNLRQIEEEVPELQIVWKEASSEIHVQVMGDVQIEILKSLIQERFHIDVEFDSGSIVYKETIQNTVLGIGHFEPLRHYAEVHLLMEPGEQGSGIQVDTHCSEEILNRNWQRLILTHLREKHHIGVLTGSQITDLKITLVAGRAHQKHTEGGDFRQATYRAVRQGLKKAKSVLLEPIYEFQLELPTEMIGRAMSDIQKMHGTFEPPITEGDVSILKGSAPVITMGGYQTEVISYTRGHGRFTCTLKGYEPCHNEDEVIAKMGYDSETDIENPTGSVFCAHGAGFQVKWQEVDSYAHVESKWKFNQEESSNGWNETSGLTASNKTTDYITQEELEEIFTRTYGPIKRERNAFNRSSFQEYRSPSTAPPSHKQKAENLETYLLVDGYNIIFAWQDLNELAQVNLEAARGRLMDMLCNYQGWIQSIIIVVFDAYKVKDNPGEVTTYHNIHVVYTKEAETADQYIEKTVHAMNRKYNVTVATSDALEQLIVWGQGATRLSAQGLREEMERVNQEYYELYQEDNPNKKHFPFEKLEDMTNDEN